MNDYTPSELDATTRHYRKTAAGLAKDLNDARSKRRWPNVSCSSCGEDFGPGDEGFSHCQDHEGLVVL